MKKKCAHVCFIWFFFLVFCDVDCVNTVLVDTSPAREVIIGAAFCNYMDNAKCKIQADGTAKST